MPAIKLYGRRWHFSTDIVPLPATVAATYHGLWTAAIIITAAASDAWPHGCQSWAGIQYIIVFAALLGSFATAFVVDVLLFYHGLKGERRAASDGKLPFQ